MHACVSDLKHNAMTHNDNTPGLPEWHQLCTYQLSEFLFIFGRFTFVFLGCVCDFSPKINIYRFIFLHDGVTCSLLFVCKRARCRPLVARVVRYTFLLPVSRGVGQGGSSVSYRWRVSFAEQKDWYLSRCRWVTPTMSSRIFNNSCRWSVCR